MIKFFRRIRQQLLSENKFSKYLLYAIGEIVLVVIGIFMALQLNTWNENRKNNEKLSSYLQADLIDLKDDLLSLNYEIDELTRFNESTKLFLNHPDYNAFTLDSLEQSLETYNVGMFAYYSDLNFKKIESSGITNYGSYEEIMKDVIRYYKHFVPFMTDIEKVVNNDIGSAENYWRYNQNIYEFNYVDGLNVYQSESERKLTLIGLLESPIPRNILKISYQGNEDYIFRAKQTQKHLSELIPKLENALEINSIQIPEEN
jgi:hypothetical protein